MEFKAHVFSTENEAVNAISLIDIGENIPRFEDSETTTYCNFETNEDYFYIRADEVTRKYIKDEQTIIIEEDFFEE